MLDLALDERVNVVEQRRAAMRGEVRAHERGRVHGAGAAVAVFAPVDKGALDECDDIAREACDELGQRARRVLGQGRRERGQPRADAGERCLEVCAQG